MKKFIVALCVCLLSVFGVVFGACDSESTVKITFVQDGQNTIVKTVEKGGSLTEIPSPVEIEGYTVAWDKTDFSVVNKSITVKAVATANEYTVYYELNHKEGTITATTQTVSFGSQIVLYTPVSSAENVVFDYWTVKSTEQVYESGVYNVVGDLTLVAHWKIEDDDSEWSELG